MARWTCPACDREFGRTAQSQTCVPGNDVARTFHGRPPNQRAAYDAIVEHLSTLGRVHADSVRVGVFLKRTRTIAEVRPKAKWLSLELVLGRKLEHSRVTRSIEVSSQRTVHVIRLFGADDVDDVVREWLTEAYETAGD